MKDNIFSGDQARESLMKGIKKVSDAVSVTMGTGGKNSLLEDFASPHYHPTNDGYSIASAILLGDPLENLGATVLKAAINRANKANGDGSSTTCLLTASILEEGMKHIGEAQPMEIMKSLQDCLPLIEESLKSQRKEIVDENGNIDFDLLEQCATISAESPEIGKMVRQIYEKIGKDGIVNWESSKTGSDYFEIGTGIKIDGATYASRWMCDEEGEGPGFHAILDNPYILLAQDKITDPTELEKVYSELNTQGIKELVIFVNEMDNMVLAPMCKWRLPPTVQGGIGFRVLVVKMPTVFNDMWWEDLSKATGARLINRASGIKMKDVKMEFLGQVNKITVTPSDTFIDGIKDLTTHILALKVDGSDEALARAARLNTKTARYFVGGLSDSTLRQRRDKVEDSVNSAWCAMQNGILPGGGSALLNTTTVMDLQSSVGAKILRTALTKPFVQIVQNAGKDPANTLKELGSLCLKGSDYDGFNSKTGELTNMMKDGIVDSFDVVLGAVKSAIGVAAGILTCGTVVLLPRQEDNLIDSVAQKVQQAMTQR